MLQLAERYAELLGTSIIPGAHHIEGNHITFVLETGPKHTMSTRQLEDAIAELLYQKEQDGESAPPAPAAPELMTGETPAPPKKKGKGKK